MKKVVSLSCCALLAFMLSCSQEIIEPIQEPVAQENTLKTGEKIQLNGKLPLIVVMQSGKRIDRALIDIEPDHIASISVLKSEAASVYGEDGKDGVVIIVLKE